MEEQPLIAKLVELVPIDLEKDMEIWEKWNRDSEYQRQLDMVPASQFSCDLIKGWFESDDFEGALFMIRSIAEKQKIGFVELSGFNWITRNAWVGIAIGEPDFRGKGYGTDAMRLILKYGFRILNLHRISLDVFEFNKRAIRSYEKCGFKLEGIQREMIYKEDKRWNVWNMAIFQSEWESMQG